MPLVKVGQVVTRLCGCSLRAIPPMAAMVTRHAGLMDTFRNAHSWNWSFVTHTYLQSVCQCLKIPQGKPDDDTTPPSPLSNVSIDLSIIFFHSVEVFCDFRSRAPCGAHINFPCVISCPSPCTTVSASFDDIICLPIYHITLSTSAIKHSTKIAKLLL